MKRFILIITVVCIASLSIFIFTGCPTATTTNDTYYINFKLDGEQKNYDKGLTDIEEKPFGVQQSLYSTDIFANPNVVSSGNETEFLCFNTGLYNVGTESGEVMIYYVKETEIYVSNSHTVTFSTYESEGGVIVGTFSAIVENSIDSEDTKSITDGEFRVKRLDNDTAWDPPWVISD